MFIYFNVCSVLSHIAQVRDILKRRKPAVLFLSETCVTSDIEEFETRCTGYSCERCDSSSRHTGGVLMYIRSDIKYSVVSNLNKNDNMWILTIKIKQKHICGLFTVLYRSPSKSVKDFVQYFSEWCEENVDYDVCNVISGDFNIDMLKESFYKTKMVKLIHDFGLQQYIEKPTRITNSSKTLIDYVLCTDSIRTEVLVDDAVADHSTVLFMENPNNVNKVERRKIEKIVGYSDESLRNRLEDYDWITTGNIDEDAFLLQERVKSTIKTYVKTCTESNKSDNKWYNSNLTTIKTERDKAHKKVGLEPSDENWDDFKRKRNRYVNELRNAEKNFTRGQLSEARGDNNKMWKLLKSLMQGIKVNNIKFIEVNGIQ